MQISSSLKKAAFFSSALLLLSFQANAQIPGSISLDLPPVPEETMEVDDETLFENPCPEPKQALQNTPNDLTKIQEDITRFNLCLQRAQLLARLNDLASQNLDTINSTFDEKLESIAAEFQAMPMPTIPVPMPSAPVQQPSPNDNKTASQAPATPAPMMAPEPVVEPISWKISEIKGIGGALTAKLMSEDGLIAQVRQGQTIPDTEIFVSKVTQTSVHVRREGERKQLGWED